VDPWNYDYSKLESLKAETVETVEDKDDTKLDDDDMNQLEDDFDLLFLGMNDQELSALQSLRAYQILECIGFVDEVIHHIYLFIIKHFRENRFDLNEQKKWLTRLADSIALLPNYVDELSISLYPPHPPDDAVCRMASNLLHFVWSVSIEIAEESMQYKNRKMVIKNKKSKSKVSLTGYQWKCKFVNLSVTFGEWFGLGTMQHIQEFVENDAKYKKVKEEKEQKKTKKKTQKKYEKKDKIRKLRKRQKRKGNTKMKGKERESGDQEIDGSGTSLKETGSNVQTETSQTASITSNVIEEEPDDMINID